MVFGVLLGGGGEDTGALRYARVRVRLSAWGADSPPQGLSHCAPLNGVSLVNVDGEVVTNIRFFVSGRG